MLEELVKEVYVQSTCLQGERLAAYALWDKDKRLKVEIELPEKSQIVSVNNAKMLKKDGRLELTEFEENGYVGIVLKTEKVENPSYDAQIKFHFEDQNRVKQTVVKEFHLFRPEVKTVNLPEHMLIDTKKDQIINAENKLKIRNDGEGIAIISFLVDEDSELKIGMPEKVDAFFSGFVKDMKKGLTELSDRYSNEKSIIQDYLDIIGATETGVTDELLGKIKNVIEEFERVLETDDAFAEEFGLVASTAFYRNLNIITDFESLLAYLASVTTKKIALTSPVNTIKIKAGKKYLKGKIQVMDLGFNLHNSIPINITIESEADGELPIYKVFD